MTKLHSSESEELSIQGLVKEIEQLKCALDREKKARTRKEKKLTSILELAPDAIIMVNEKSVIGLVNHEAEKMFGYSRNELEGKNISILIPARFHGDHANYAMEFSQKSCIRPMGKKLNTVGLKKDNSEFPVDIALSCFNTNEGIIITSIIRDITNRKREEAHRESLINELQEAMDRIKVLSGLLPICADCKKIRDDKGHWNHLESYIMDHSDTRFTHSICPECFDKYNRRLTDS